MIKPMTYKSRKQFLHNGSKKALGFRRLIPLINYFDKYVIIKHKYYRITERKSRYPYTLIKLSGLKGWFCIADNRSMTYKPSAKQHLLNYNQWRNERFLLSL